LQMSSDLCLQLPWLSLRAVLCEFCCSATISCGCSRVLDPMRVLAPRGRAVVLCHTTFPWSSLWLHVHFDRRLISLPFENILHKMLSFVNHT
jgi:hypothetical protein